jgi:hypothetical protein
MKFLHIDEKNKGDISKLNEYMKEGKHAFILVYMEGCGPCNATRPEWAKLKQALDEKYKSDDSVVIADVNKDYLNDLQFIGSVDGFPTLKHIWNRGKSVESYEECTDVREKDRSVDSFIQWIEVVVQSDGIIRVESSSSPRDLLERLKGGKNKTNKRRHKKRNHTKRRQKTRKTRRRYRR